MIPLITSIPPNISRKTSDGREIGETYARHCIRSWRACGFDPVTVNANSEQLSQLIEEEGVRCINVPRDARQQFGKPLVYLDDFVAAACSLTDGPAAITNADILLDMPEDMQRRIATIEPGECLVARRFDIQEPNSREGSEFTYGYDFFAFHTRDVEAFRNDGFVIGLPWWDHYFPLQLFLRGLRSLPVSRPFVYHLEHAERWEFENWVSLGNRFLSSMRATAKAPNFRGTPAVDYNRRLALAVAGHDGRLLSRIKEQVSRLRRTEPLTDEIQVLGRVAAVNVEWLDERRSCG